MAAKKKANKVRAFRLVRIRPGRIEQFPGIPLDCVDRLTATNIGSFTSFFSLRIGDIILVLEERDVRLRSGSPLTLSRTDVVTFRKVILPDGSTRWFSKELMWRPPSVPWRFKEIKS